MNAAHAAARKGEAQERRVLTRQEAELNAAHAAAALHVDLTATLFDARHTRLPGRWDCRDRGQLLFAL